MSRTGGGMTVTLSGSAMALSDGLRFCSLRAVSAPRSCNGGHHELRPIAK